MEIRKFIALMVLMLFPSVLAQETVIIPFQEVVQGEPLNLKYTLVSENGEPLIGAKVRAKTDFFNLELLDDGNHDDNAANDGIYGNKIDTGNVTEGTYVITYAISVGSFSKTTTSSFKIIARPLVTQEQATYILIAAVGGLLASFVISRIYKKSAFVKDRIKQLENKKSNLETVIDNLEKDFYKRVITAEMFKERMQKNREEIMEIDSELARLKEKIKK